MKRPCLVAGCGIVTRHGPLCGDCRFFVPSLMEALAERTPSLWLDVARYVEGLRAERASMRRVAS